MVIVKIMEGLGNQMFEYACGRSLALFKNTQLKLDLEEYQKPSYPRQYKLGHLRILENFPASAESQKFKKYKGRNGIRGSIYNLFWADQKRYFKEKQIFVFDAQIEETAQDVYLEGYWQSYKYFENIESTIRKEFSLKEKTSDSYQKILKEVGSGQTASIHIRRGDYKKPELPQYLLPLDYYQSAIKLIGHQVQPTHFFVFSDDPDWAKENLRFSGPVTFVSDANLEDYEELMLMSNCDHQIIANSSFSWWGAWLNKNPDKTVIAPQQWFTDPTIKIDDLIPENWIKI